MRVSLGSAILWGLLMWQSAWAAPAAELKMVYFDDFAPYSWRDEQGKMRGLMIDVMKTYGVESFQGRLAAIIQGSTETTFYVLAVYFGSVGVKHHRHALACALLADAVGLVAAIGVGYAMWR